MLTYCLCIMHMLFTHNFQFANIRVFTKSAQMLQINNTRLLHVESHSVFASLHFFLFC